MLKTFSKKSAKTSGKADCAHIKNRIGAAICAAVFVLSAAAAGYTDTASFSFNALGAISAYAANSDAAVTSGSTIATNSSDSSSSSDSDSTDASKPHGTVYTNTVTGYSVIMEDDALLLDTDEANDLIEVMKPVTAYGNVAFKSTYYDSYSDTSYYASSYYASKFGYDSGTVFVIDMDNRNIWIHSNGKVNSVITKSYANTITDNVYRYASREDYYTCASEAYSQIITLLDGGRISQPMKYVSNALLALAAAILINYVIVRIYSRHREASSRDIVSGIFANNAFNNPKVNLIRQTRTYSPASSDSGGSGSSHSGGGHSGGGGGGGSSHSSGSGGGHSF